MLKNFIKNKILVKFNSLNNKPQSNQPLILNRNKEGKQIQLKNSNQKALIYNNLNHNSKNCLNLKLLRHCHKTY